MARGYRGWGGSAPVTHVLARRRELDFAHRSFQVLHRPGHSPTDTVFFDAEDGTLIAGDHLIGHISSNPLIALPPTGEPTSARRACRSTSTRSSRRARCPSRRSSPATDRLRRPRAADRGALRDARAPRREAPRPDPGTAAHRPRPGPRALGQRRGHAGAAHAERGARPRRPADRARRGHRARSTTASSTSTPPDVENVEVILVLLLLAVVVLSAAARAINVPYPIVLVVGGALLGLPAGCRRSSSTRTSSCVIFLPPLLYSAAFFANLNDLRREPAPDHRCASIGLVLATMVAVAVVAHALIPGISWPVGVHARRDRRPDRPGRRHPDRPPAGRPAAARLDPRGREPGQRRDRAGRLQDRASRRPTSAVAFSLLDAGWEFLWKAAGGIARRPGRRLRHRRDPQAAQRPAAREHDRPAERLRRLRPGRAARTSPPCSPP